MWFLLQCCCYHSVSHNTVCNCSFYNTNLKYSATLQPIHKSCSVTKFKHDLLKYWVCENTNVCTDFSNLFQFKWMHALEFKCTSTRAETGNESSTLSWCNKSGSVICRKWSLTQLVTDVHLKKVTCLRKWHESWRHLCTWTEIAVSLSLSLPPSLPPWPSQWLWVMQSYKVLLNVGAEVSHCRLLAVSSEVCPQGVGVGFQDKWPQTDSVTATRGQLCGGILYEAGILECWMLMEMEPHIGEWAV